MRKFIPLSVFNELYSNQSDLLTAEGMNSFRNQLVINGNRIAEGAGFNSDQFAAFQDTLLDPSNIVFYGWVEQHIALKNALLGGKLSIFIDSAKHLNHTLSKNYKIFLSPVLSDKILRAKINTDAERKVAFSFVQLLDERHRAVVEDKLFQPFRDRLNELKPISDTTKDEQELVNLVQPICSDEIIDCVNYLSRASYASKLGYVDKILDTIHSKACSVRFANWVLERMSHVELNTEHLYKITDLRKDLRKGNLTVKNHKRGRTPIRWKALFTVLLVSLLVGSVVCLIVYRPFSEVTKPEFSNNTSFREFSKEERIRMDSLLREMDNPFDKVDSLDPLMTPVQTGVDIDLVLRKSFKNERMESIYEDLALDSELKENYPDSTCADANNSLFQSNEVFTFNPLSVKTGKHTAVVRNESEYSIILYVADNNKSGSVHASFIKPNETIEFKINEFNTILIVAGNKYQAFFASKDANKDELPSEKFVQHFCDTDQNYAETINTAYQFMHPQNGKNKFMVMGAKSGYVHLVDVHGVLKSY